MGSVKFLVIFSVAALHLAVVPGCIRANQFVADAKMVQLQLKHGRLFTSFWQKSVGELSAIVRLYAFNQIGKALDNMAKEHCGRIGAVFLKSLKIAKAAVFVQKGILEPLCWLLLAHDAGLRNKLDVNLYSLAGILHLLIRLWDVFGIRRFYSHGVPLSQKPVQPRDGTFVTSLSQLNPEYDDPGMWISAAHIQDKLDLFRRVLVGMAVRSVRSVFQRGKGSVIAFAPAVDILPVCAVAYSGFCYAIFLCIQN